MFKNKFFFGAFIIATTIGSISAGVRGGEAWSRLDGPRTEMSLGEMLQRDASAHNKRKGERIGEAIFERAYVSGRSLVIEFKIEKPPQRINASATEDRLQERMKSQFCRSAFASVMRKGGAMVYRYNTPCGLTLVDAKIDAGVCRLA